MHLQCPDVTTFLMSSQADVYKREDCSKLVDLGQWMYNHENMRHVLKVEHLKWS